LQLNIKIISIIYKIYKLIPILVNLFNKFALSQSYSVIHLSIWWTIFIV